MAHFSIANFLDYIPGFYVMSFYMETLTLIICLKNFTKLKLAHAKLDFPKYPPNAYSTK